MTIFETLRNLFRCGWATLLVGWRGAGVCSPWPDDWERFPPMITHDEVLAFCEERICSASDDEQVGIVDLIEALNDKACSRVHVLTRLASLCKDSHVDENHIEIRKWRCSCIAQQLDEFDGKDVVAKVRDIEETFVEFGSLGGVPEDMKESAWATDPKAHYEESQCAAELAECRKWLESEVASICGCDKSVNYV